MKSAKPQYFHLTLGPVQGFVAQARRTRDFWAGSFLLSWLASVAMVSVQRQGGEIDFPIPDEDFLKALQGEVNSIASLPAQGSVPNRFKAFGARVEHDFEPQLIVDAVQQAWLALCHCVWENDLMPVLGTRNNAQVDLTKTIWYRQLTQYWEISWCLTDDHSVSNLLDRRKNWRSHHLPDEPGIKCMMMEGFQELSGLIYPDASKLNAFWNRLRQGLPSGEMDLREGECLSALGFVKRRFVRHFDRLDITLDNKVRLKGWSLKPQVPSLLYLAAAPWYTQALNKAATEESVRGVLDDFLQAAKAFAGTPEAATPLSSVEQAVQRCGLNPHWAGIDGSVFHASSLAVDEKCSQDPTKAQAAGQLIHKLTMLRKRAGLPEPNSFYAVLIMDGDSLGSQMSDPDKQKRISEGLNRFTRSVPEIVKQHDGFLVYAGGDDVLALVTVDQAVTLARCLREHYAHCFVDQNQGNKNPVVTSLSGAIQFSHVKNPLTFVLQDAHHLLDDVAKDQTGRDALAIRVWKPGGLHLEWSQPWEHLLQHQGYAQDLLSDVVDRFREREAHSPFTNKFIFKMIEVLQRLPDNLRHYTQGQQQRNLLTALIKAELLHSGLDLQKTADREAEVAQLIDPLLLLATPHQRQTDARGQTCAIQSLGVFNGDGLKLVRFLAQGGAV